MLVLAYGFAEDGEKMVVVQEIKSNEDDVTERKLAMTEIFFTRTSVRILKKTLKIRLRYLLWLENLQELKLWVSLYKITSKMTISISVANHLRGFRSNGKQTPASGPPVDALMGSCRHCSMAAAKNSIIKELHCRHVN